MGLQKQSRQRLQRGYDAIGLPLPEPTNLIKGFPHCLGRGMVEWPRQRLQEGEGDDARGRRRHPATA